MVEIAPENEKLFEWSLKCETKYITDSKVCYTINWKEGRVDWNISSTKSSTAVTNLFLQKINQNRSTKLSGPRLFGFDIEPLYNFRLQIGLQPVIKDNNRRKRPLEEISSRSQQNKRLNSFGRDVQKAIDELIIKHKLTNLSGEPIVHLCYIELDYKEDQQAYIKFKNPNNSSAIQTRVDAIVRVCDEAVLGRDGYRNLAAVVPTLFREYLIANRRNEMNELMNMQIHIGIFNIDNEINNQSNIDNNINNNVNDILVDDHEIGNGAFRSILDILKILIPIWKAGQNPVIFPGDTLYIKIGGDGRNVRRRQNHVMITFCLLNEKKEVLKPDHQYCICLYIGHENYKDLAKVGQLFQDQLFDLKNSGIIDQDGVNWPVELFFCGDWKFMYIIMGTNAPNSKYFCLYCNCKASLRWDMNKIWNNTENTRCERKSPLFPAINQKNYIPDELHLFLRISDVLMECLFADLIKKKEFQKQIKPAVELAFKNIKVHFKFFQSGKNWNWTSLMGPDKKKTLKEFPVSQFIPDIRGEDIEKLWREFYRLYTILHKEYLSDQEIDQFEIDTQNWICTFYRPTQGHMNSGTQISGLYRKDDVTPYMHVFAKHVPQFMRQLKEIGLSLRTFSTSSIEKKNHNHVCLFFGGTTMGGGTDGKSVVYNIMSFENRQLFYLINNTPKKIIARNIDVNNKES
ncbi:hypothetical protein RhiirA5_385841 [Rhizophagus irregularis]|uniref:Uncharacterized protein n=2 Tax=Rhizophagus irregularis TaxID=588596 RepID=A0A2N0NM76_9GLOM|nr:hypothetical protein RhiirA5_385841 [Rhizophagus irregularis]